MTQTEPVTSEPEAVEYSAIEKLSGLVVIADAVKKHIDQARKEVRAEMVAAKESSRSTALGEVRRAEDKVKIIDTAAWEEYAKKSLGAKSVREYEIIDAAAAIPVLLEHAPDLIRKRTSVPASALRNLEDTLVVDGDVIRGVDDEELPFAEVAPGTVSVASSTAKKEAIARVSQYIDLAITPVGLAAIGT